MSSVTQVLFSISYKINSAAHDGGCWARKFKENPGVCWVRSFVLARAVNTTAGCSPRPLATIFNDP